MQTDSRWAITIAAVLVGVFAACSSSPDGGAARLGESPTIPQTCQACLSQSSSNECRARATICEDDPDCAQLNSCINTCPNIDQACAASCGDGASQSAIDEWVDWSICDCGTCASECSQTFCAIQGSGSGSGMTGVPE